MTQPKTVRVALVGGTGYTGYEAVRWLLRHPRAELAGVYGGPESRMGPMEKFFPQLSRQTAAVIEPLDSAKLADAGVDVVLLCVPHKVAMSYVPQLRDAGLRVVDLSADYRLHDPEVYRQWYAHDHADAPRLAEAVYGLPEFFADDIRSAGLVANPGCYPTCTALGLAPLLKAGLIEPDGIVVNAVSGVSGAGRTPKQEFHFPERSENFEPYGVGTHRHTPEMEQTLSAVTGREVELLFQPHLCPIDRGMLGTMYARPTGDASAEQLAQALRDAYANAPFVRVRDDVLPATRYVNHTNYCDLAVRVARGRVIVFSAIDNLVKGASGQAIQNMNLMFGLDETAGLV